MNNVREEYRSTTAKKSKFMSAVLIGALAGAAVSFLDKNTRKSVMATSKNYMSNMKEMVTNPNSLLSQVRETSSQFRSTVEKISDDVSFISQRVSEMKDIPNQVAQVVKETKDAFTADQQTQATTDYSMEKSNPLN